MAGMGSAFPYRSGQVVHARANMRGGRRWADDVEARACWGKVAEARHPPWATVSSRAMARPRPVPPALAEPSEGDEKNAGRRAAAGQAVVPARMERRSGRRHDEPGHGYGDWGVPPAASRASRAFLSRLTRDAPNWSVNIDNNTIGDIVAAGDARKVCRWRRRRWQICRRGAWRSTGTGFGWRADCFP